MLYICNDHTLLTKAPSAAKKSPQLNVFSAQVDGSVLGVLLGCQRKCEGNREMGLGSIHLCLLLYPGVEGKGLFLALIVAYMMVCKK